MRAYLSSLVAAWLDAADRRGEAGEPELSRVRSVLLADYAEGHESDEDPAADPVESVVRIFGLNPVEAAILVAACAPDVDDTLGAAFSAVQGGRASGYLSVGLALELCGQGSLSVTGRSALGAAGPLRRFGLLHVHGDGPWLGRELRPAERVVSALLGDRTPEPDLTRLLVETLPLRLAGTDRVAGLVAAGAPLVWVNEGLTGAGLSLAAGALESVGLDYLSADLGRVAEPRLADVTGRLVREAGLQESALIVLGAEVLGDHGLLSLLAEAPVPVVGVAGRPFDASWSRTLPVTVAAAPLAVGEREQLWAGTTELPAPETAVDRAQWADLYRLRLRPEDVLRVVRSANLESKAHGGDLDLGMLRQAARRLGGSGQRGAARQESGGRLEDLILDEDSTSSIRELISWATHRDAVLESGPLAGGNGRGRGISALFSGSPGTGKSLAARVIAGSLGLDLHTVELSTVISKYIGETEKNLESVFREAESLNVVLFFDEADALFGSRSEVRDSRDRYANQEVSYLLQRMEAFEGITVLATNLRGNLDAAFSRRLQFIVHFPDPDPATRKRLWQLHLDALPRLAADDPPDLAALAAHLEIAGGEIRNIVLAAAYSAAAGRVDVGMRHLLAAASREYRKLGRRLPALLT